MSKGKLACLAAAIAIGAALIGAPALAQGAGGGMGWHGGGGMGWHGGGAGWHGAAWRGAPIRSAAINSGAWRGAAWRGAAWRGAAWHGGWHGRFFPRRRFAFFHHRRFFGPFVGLYASGYGSCWSWVPTPAGWQYVWVCGSSDYGYY
jgi:hypothetical protein